MDLAPFPGPFSVRSFHLFKVARWCPANVARCRFPLEMRVSVDKCIRSSLSDSEARNIRRTPPVARHPGLFIEGLLRSVDAQEDEETLAGDGAQPVLSVAAGGRIRTEVEIDRSVCVDGGLVHLIDRGERLSVVQARAGDGIVDGHRPEQMSGNAFGQIQFVAL